MEVYRIVRKKYRKDLGGQGSRMYGGRWNSKGTAILYTAQSVSLAAFELAVHTPLPLMPKDLYLMKVALPKVRNMDIAELKSLPRNWNKHPPVKGTQKVGDEFVDKGEPLMLRVPSAVIPNEYNFLINPMHPLMTKVKVIEAIPFAYDKRLFFG